MFGLVEGDGGKRKWPIAEMSREVLKNIFSEKANANTVKGMTQVDWMALATRHMQHNQLSHA